MSSRVRQSSAMFERLWIDETVEVDAEPTAIHALLIDIDRWPTWVPGLRSLRRVRTKPLRADRRFGMLLSMPPLPTFWVPCQLYVSRPDFIEWGGHGPRAAIRHRFELTPLPSGKTRVRHVEYSTNWLALILIPLEGVFRRHDERWTKALAAHFAVEAESPAQPAAA
ncbi:MAG: hypothetical protein Q7V62_01335 [Actinomycetota bacterium]|nr:hypothetical protein [Actinomycetota bacterium]